MTKPELMEFVDDNKRAAIHYKDYVEVLSLKNVLTIVKMATIENKEYQTNQTLEEIRARFSECSGDDVDNQDLYDFLKKIFNDKFIPSCSNCANIDLNTGKSYAYCDTLGVNINDFNTFYCLYWNDK